MAGHGKKPRIWPKDAAAGKRRRLERPKSGGCAGFFCRCGRPASRTGGRVAGWTESRRPVPGAGWSRRHGRTCASPKPGIVSGLRSSLSRRTGSTTVSDVLCRAVVHRAERKARNRESRNNAVVARAMRRRRSPDDDVRPRGERPPGGGQTWNDRLWRNGRQIMVRHPAEKLFTCYAENIHEKIRCSGRKGNAATGVFADVCFFEHRWYEIKSALIFCRKRRNVYIRKWIYVEQLLRGGKNVQYFVIRRLTALESALK